MGEKARCWCCSTPAIPAPSAGAGKDAAPPDIADVRAALAGAGNGVMVLSSSRGSERWRKSPNLQNGAFSEAVIAALEGRGDGDGDGWLTVDELERSVVEQVRELTEDGQNPTMTVLPSGQPLRDAAVPRHALGRGRARDAKGFEARRRSFWRRSPGRRRRRRSRR